MAGFRKTIGIFLLILGIGIGLSSYTGISGYAILEGIDTKIILSLASFVLIVVGAFLIGKK